MQCAQHPAVAATAVCSRCDRPVCPECKQERNGKAFCPSCAEHLDRRAQAAPRPLVARSAPPPTGEVAVVPPATPTVAPDAPRPAAVAGDLYEGPAIRDVYTGPLPDQLPDELPPPEEPTLAPLEPEVPLPPVTVADTTSPQLFLYAPAAGVLGGAVWYGIAVASGYKSGWLAILIGTLVGIAAAWGAGGGGQIVTLVALLTTASTLGLGDYLIAQHNYGRIEAEATATWAASLKFLDDGRLSDAELATYLKMSPSSLASMSTDEIASARRAATEKLRRAATEIDQPKGTFNDFWASMIDLKDMIFYAIALLTAGRMTLEKA